MRFVVLGPVTVFSDGQRHSFARAQTRGLLALLLLQHGQPISRDAMANALWGGAAPTTARAQVHNMIFSIRTRLTELGRPEIIETGPFGCRLAVDPALIDAASFTRYVQRARAIADDSTEAVRLLRAGLSLWTGEPLLDAAGAFVESARARLVDSRLAALEDLADLELRQGRADLVSAELPPVVEAHPLRERLRARLMLALYRSGRRAEALRTCRDYRSALAEEEGLEPGHEIAELERLILRADPSLDLAAAAPAGAALRSAAPPMAATALPVPAQLPPDVAAFTGRTAYLRRLDGLLPPMAGAASPAVVISAVAGGAGFGKTALAVHWGHRVRASFPDGQLYINLRGYAATSPLRPIEALTQFLRALGVAAAQMPIEVEEAAGLYRSLLSDRRMLVLLDNARTADQVRPLLPGSATCRVIVTSRDSLTGLVAHDGADHVALDVLPPADAHALLGRILGAERVGEDPAETAELARLCAYLPLALRIAAAKLAVQPTRRIGDLIRELTSGNRIAALEVEGDGYAAVQATLDLSYRTLDSAARRLFRLLGLVPGPDVTIEAAAALADVPAEVASHLLTTLTMAHLIEPYAPTRFAFHDLLRLYARDRANTEEDDTVRAAALDRLFSHYLCTVDQAATLLAPQILRLPAPRPAAAPIAFGDAEQASAWLDAERANLLAAIRYAAESGPRSSAWLLADGLRGYFQLRMCIVDWTAAAEAALTAAQAEENLTAQAAAHLSLGNIHWRRCAYQHATERYTTALGLARRADWVAGQAAALNNLACVHHVSGNPARAAQTYTEALALNRDTGDVGGQAVQLGNLGTILAELGRPGEAIDHLRKGLLLYREASTKSGEAWALACLGEVHYLLGHRDEGQDHLENALTIMRALGDRGMEAIAVRALAVMHGDAGRYTEALDLAHSAVALARAVDHRRGEASAQLTLGAIYGLMNDVGQALAHHDTAVQLSADTGGYLEIEAITGLASAQQRAGRTDLARVNAYRALAAARQAGYALIEGYALIVVAAIDLHDGKIDNAVQMAEEAAVRQQEIGHPLGQARALMVLGRAASRAEDPRAAARHWRRALELFTSVGAAEAEDARARLTRSVRAG